MVKVQKPEPKILRKNVKNEGVIKEKGIVKNNAKKKSKSDASRVPVADVKKTKDSVQSKEKIYEKEKTLSIEATNKKADVLKKSKPKRKPLVLAPPASPVTVAPKAIKKRVKVSESISVSSSKRSKPLKHEVNDVKLTIKSAVSKKGKEKKRNEDETLSGKLAAKDISKPSKVQNPSKLEKPPQPSKKLLQKAKLKLANKKVSLALNKNKQKTKKTNLVNKKSPNAVELKYEIKPFDEDRFNEIVCESNVQKVCSALINQVSEEVKKGKTKTIFSDYRYILQICCYKIPSCPKRVVKLNLKHSLVGIEDDVALIVTDLQRGARFDYEPTVQHYEDLLREAGIKQRLTVVPFNRLRNDMGTFEAKRKFLNSYDYLLCDGRISGQASAFLGSYTQKPRNVLHAVRLSKENQLAKEISHGLCRTAYRQLRKGDLIAIPVGNHEHSGQQLTENVLCVIQQLQQLYPGGLANIRSIYLKIDIVGTSAIPLYISMCAPPTETPYVVGTREQRMLKLKKQANEVLTRFALTKEVDFVKLTHDQVKRKVELREKRFALVNEGDELLAHGSDDAVVPPKKARKNAGKKEIGKEIETKGQVDDEDSDANEHDDDDDNEN